MNCPKCGFSQVERIDCIRCGIVFSKYYALHFPMTGTSAPPPEKAAPPPAGPDPATDGQIAELRQNFRELQRRLVGYESGAAERQRLRSDLQALGERLRTEMDQLAARVCQVEGSLEEPANGAETVSPEDFLALEKELKEVYLHSIRDRMDGLEDRMDGLEELKDGLEDRLDAVHETASGPGAEVIRRLEARIGELDARVSSLLEDWHGKGASDLLPKLERGLADLDELRNSLQAVTVRYSEIGELKKNHLVVLNSLDSVRTGLESFKRQIADGFPRTLAELAREVAALRAEYRQLWTQLSPVPVKQRDD